MATGTPRVSLNGIPLGGANRYGWPLVAGVTPHEERWTVSNRFVEQVRPLLGKPQTFKIEGPRETYEVEKLYPIQLLPGSNPHEHVLVVADRRWLIGREHVCRHFNIRRLDGRKRFNDNNGQLQEENAVFDPEFEFAAYSLFANRQPWTAKAALDEVLLALFGADWDTRDFPVVGDPEIRDIIIDDSGEHALALALGFVPGANLYVDRRGKAIVYNQLSGTERKVLTDLGNRQQAVGAVAAMVDNSVLRPSKVRVLFDPELECRVEFATSRVRGKLQLDPITQSVDGRLQITDPLTQEQRVVGLGSWEHSDAVYEAWGVFGQSKRPLSNERLAVHAASGFKLVEALYATNSAGAPSAQGARRLASAVSSYRRDFALDREAFGRLRSLQPNRVSILNRMFGSRVPSPVFTDWIRVPSMVGLSNVKARAWDIAGGVNVGQPLSEGQIAPATVSTIAPGMFRFEPRQQDWGGLAQATHFGRPSQGILPSNDVGSDANRTGLDVYAASEFLEFDPAFRLATIMTASPGAPNNNRRMHVVEVTPDQVRGRLGRAVGECLGPPITVRIPPSLMTAKFGYSDALRDEIERLVLGGDAVAELAPDETGEIDSVRDLLVNEDFVQSFAEAAAAAVYSRFIDRPAGVASVDMNAEIEPTGAISRVDHEMVDGVTRTVVRFSDPRQLPSLFRYLDQDVRQALLGEEATNVRSATGV